MIRVFSGWASAAEAARVEGGAVIQGRRGEEVASNPQGGKMLEADIIYQGLEPLGFQAGVVDTKRILRRKVRRQGPAGGA